MRIGVLAVQGDFARHRRSLDALGLTAVEVRRSVHLNGLDGLIVPGGESTAFDILLRMDDLGAELARRVSAGLPTWGTCAGAIILGKGDERPQPRLSAIDIEVRRNAYGRQVDSFVAPLNIEFLSEPFPGVFIRAPQFFNPGPEVETLCTHADAIVMARQKSILISAFHPELTDDLRIHQWFLENLCR